MSMPACPKCGFDNPAELLECQRCGVIFARLRSPERLPDINVLVDPNEELSEEGTRLRHLFLGASGEVNTFVLAVEHLF